MAVNINVDIAQRDRDQNIINLRTKIVIKTLHNCQIERLFIRMLFVSNSGFGY